jgi:uncharacterized membrane protein
MKEIPLPLIKSNQAGIVLFILAGFLLQQPILIYILFAVQLIGLVFGANANLFIRLARLIFPKQRLRDSEQQAVELARFNQSIAVTLLAAASLALILGWTVAAYIFAGMVALAAAVAIAGYCIGCTLYFQYKRWKQVRFRT